MPSIFLLTSSILPMPGAGGFYLSAGSRRGSGNSLSVKEEGCSMWFV